MTVTRPLLGFPLGFPISRSPCWCGEQTGKKWMSAAAQSLSHVDLFSIVMQRALITGKHGVGTVCILFLRR
jgi:hypothetical protein